MLTVAIVALVLGVFLGVALIRVWDNRKAKRAQNKDWQDVKVGLTD